MTLKETVSKAISIALITTSIGYLPLSCASFEKKDIYRYVLNKHFNENISNTLIEKLSPFNGNDKKFIGIISDYSEELQKVCVNSDILDNKHVSNKELEATKKATLEGIVNPKEVYGVVANGAADGYYFIPNTLTFYKQLKDNNVHDDNITLLIHNPDNNNNIFETPSFDFYSKEGVKRITVKDGKPALSTISLSNLLPQSEDEIEIDISTTRTSFLNSIINLPSDFNDDVYIGYFSHGVEYKTSDLRPIQFPESNMSSRDLNYAISKLDHDKMTIVQGSCYAANLLRDINGPHEIKNVLAIASSDIYEESGVPFFINFITQQLNNPKKSVKEILEIEKAIYNSQLDENQKTHPQVFFYNENGKSVSPEECSWNHEPFLVPQN